MFTLVILNLFFNLFSSYNCLGILSGVKNIQFIDAANTGWLVAQGVGPGGLLEKYETHIILGVFVLLSISIVIFCMNNSLKKQVAARTKELTKEINDKNIALMKAKESDVLKTAFLNNLSHEIRTPMNAITGFSTLLRDKEITREQIDQYTKIIDNSTAQLLGIVDDILDMALIESKQVVVNTHEIDLDHLLFSLYERFENEVGTKNIKIKLIFPENRIDRIYSDRTKLRQILTNLLVNAFKFTPEGEISFGYNNKGKHIRFFVKDTGIGIPDEIQGKIFERFFKNNPDGYHYLGGSGLGLPISKSYAELLGGKMWVESNKGRGSVFYFSLPLKDKGVQKKQVSTDIKVKSNQSYESDLPGVKIPLADNESPTQLIL